MTRLAIENNWLPKPNIATPKPPTPDDAIVHRVARARRAMLCQNVIPTSLYLGNEHYDELMSTLDRVAPIGEFDQYQGMRVYRVSNDPDHLAVR